MSWIRRRPVAVEGIEGGRRWRRKALLHGERICGDEPLLLEDAVDGLEEEETTDRYGSVSTAVFGLKRSPANKTLLREGVRR